MEWRPREGIKTAEDETFSEMQMRHAVEIAKKVEQISKQFYEDGLKASPFNPNQSVRTQAITDIVHLVAMKHNVTDADIRGYTRVRKVAWARQEAYWTLRNRGMKLQAIGDYFKRDHTTVMTGISRHEERIT